jgi:prepilin-type N-terminal cleavage/methylation domain-containing protein
MKNSGLTLVELMVVVVIIGILAGVATPKYKNAADKTKAAEAPQTLTAIAGGEESYRIANGGYVELKSDGSPNDLANWQRIGMKVPDSRYFKYTVETSSDVPLVDASSGITLTDETNPLAVRMPTFTAKATLLVNLSGANAGDVITINEKGEKKAPKGLNALISSFGATPQP